MKTSTEKEELCQALWHLFGVGDPEHISQNSVYRLVPASLSFGLALVCYVVLSIRQTFDQAAWSPTAVASAVYLVFTIVPFITVEIASRRQRGLPLLGVRSVLQIVLCAACFFYAYYLRGDFVSAIGDLLRDQFFAAVGIPTLINYLDLVFPSLVKR